MPYIKRKDKERVHCQGMPELGNVIDYQAIKTPGELNYAITVMLKHYFEKSKGNYQAINDIIGALEGAKLEFYRRVAAPYEDGKIKENGDVY